MARSPLRSLTTDPCSSPHVGRVQIVACVPRMTVLCDDRTPPLPCAIAVSQSAIWRAPHSRRSWRAAAGLQRGISLIDDLQLLLGCLAAAMGIGMMQFD